MLPLDIKGKINNKIQTNVNRFVKKSLVNELLLKRIFIEKLNEY